MIAATLVEAPRGTKADMIRAALVEKPDASGSEIAEMVNTQARSKGYDLECKPVEVYQYKPKSDAATTTDANGTATPRKVRVPKMLEPAAPKEVTVSECVAVMEFCKPAGGMEIVAKRLKELKDINTQFGSLDRFEEIMRQTATLTGDKKLAKIFETDAK
jgi:hypothetical protein